MNQRLRMENTNSVANRIESDARLAGRDPKTGQKEAEKGEDIEDNYRIGGSYLMHTKATG